MTDHLTQTIVTAIEKARADGAAMTTNPDTHDLAAAIAAELRGSNTLTLGLAPPRVEDAMERLIRDEFARLAGHLLRKYGDDPGPEAQALATLAGYMLGHYGPDPRIPF